MAKRSPKRSEQIIIAQSILLVAFALACYSASDAIQNAWFAINNANSMVAIATDSLILTEKTTVDLTSTKTIVENFNYVCAVVLLTGLTIGAITAYKTIKSK